MLIEVRATNEQGSTLSLPLSDVGGYRITNVDGLGPPKANVSLVDFYGMDGSAFQNASLPMRSVTMNIDLVGQSIENLRRGLYPYFGSKLKVRLEFVSDISKTLCLTGYVETFETNPFSKDSSVTIGLICPDPYLYETTPQVTGRTSSGQFEAFNSGSADTGIIFSLDKYASISSYGPTLSRVTPNPSKMELNGLVLMDDLFTVQVNTTRGSRSANVRSSQTFDPSVVFDGTNILGSVTGWLELVPGMNTLDVYFDWSVTMNAVTTVSWINRYLGV